MKKKVLLFVFSFFVCLFNVYGKSASCTYDLISLSIDNNYKVTLGVTRPIQRISISSGVVYKDFIKEENGKEIYWCPPYIYLNVNQGHDYGLTYYYTFVKGEKMQKIELTDSNVDNAGATNSDTSKDNNTDDKTDDKTDGKTDNKTDNKTDSSKKIVRFCKYASYTVYYYNDGSAEISNGKKTQNFDLKGKDISDYCPEELYVGMYEDQFGATFEKDSRLTKIDLTTDNSTTYDPKDFKEGSNTIDDLPINDVEICKSDSKSLKIFQVIGYLILIAKIIAPIILIILGSITFGKAALSNDDKAMMDAAVMFGKKVLIGLIIFFVPTILDFGLSLISGVSDTMQKFEPCTACILSPNDSSRCSPQNLQDGTTDNNANSKDKDSDKTDYSGSGGSSTGGKF